MVMLGDNIFERSLRPCVDAFAKQKEGARDGYLMQVVETDCPERIKGSAATAA